MTDQRLLLVSPVRNEAEHVRTMIRSVAAQARPPDLWLMVDDGSEDGTAAIVAEAGRSVPFLRLLSAPQDVTQGDNETRLARAAEAAAFNWALRQVDLGEFTHVGKLDGDIELPPEYFERLLGEFERDPRLGIAGGAFAELGSGGWRRVRTPSYHVPGALKLYSTTCLRAVGGVREHLGWDTIDETYARMRGFSTRSFQELLAHHHRAWGSVGGRLRGSARYGTCAYAARYPAYWVTLRSLKIAAKPPFLLSGGAFFFGYLRAAASRAPRAEDPELVRFVRAELRARIGIRRRRLPGASLNGADCASSG